jgi:hypothetical protein
VELAQGTTIGDADFAPGNTAEGGQGEPIGELDCIDVITLHYHAHVSLFVAGRRVAIPMAIGIVDPVISEGFVQNGSCLYWMHTHDGSGLIHIEPAHAGEFTVGDLFDIWGQPLTESNVAGFEGTVSVFVDGLRHDGDPRSVVLESRKHVSLQVGSPLASPPMYIFQG